MRYKLYIFIVVPFLIIGIVFFILYKKPLYVSSANPEEKKFDLSLVGYNDIYQKGNSTIQFGKEASGKINYSYTLKEGAPFPYVGILFSKKDTSLFDLSDYDYVRIRIKASSGTRIPFTITTNIAGYSKKENDLTYRNNQYVLTTTNKETEIIAPLEKFETPDWWYTTYNLTEQKLGAPDFSMVKTIQLNNCINLKKNVKDFVEVEEISFHTDLQSFYIFSGIFLLGYFGLGFLFFNKKKAVAKKEVNFKYEKIEVINHLDKEEAAVFGFITSNYSNPELAIIDVQTAVGLHERKVSAIIKNKTELNFKQFLNKLRISEAKRLLSETDLQISEIAFKVGYGNASHFNRVFKSSENCSPNDFRKEHFRSV
jgi:AraC-like DNA-binding protein